MKMFHFMKGKKINHWNKIENQCILRKIAKKFDWNDQVFCHQPFRGWVSKIETKFENFKDSIWIWISNFLSLSIRLSDSQCNEIVWFNCKIDVLIHSTKKVIGFWSFIFLSIYSIFHLICLKIIFQITSLIFLDTLFSI